MFQNHFQDFYLIHLLNSLTSLSPAFSASRRVHVLHSIRKAWARSAALLYLKWSITHDTRTSSKKSPTLQRDTAGIASRSFVNVFSYTQTHLSWRSTSTLISWSAKLPKHSLQPSHCSTCCSRVFTTHLAHSLSPIVFRWSGPPPLSGRFCKQTEKLIQQSKSKELKRHWNQSTTQKHRFPSRWTKNLVPTRQTADGFRVGLSSNQSFAKDCKSSKSTFLCSASKSALANSKVTWPVSYESHWQCFQQTQKPKRRKPPFSKAVDSNNINKTIDDSLLCATCHQLLEGPLHHFEKLCELLILLHFGAKLIPGLQAKLVGGFSDPLRWNAS